MTAANPQSLRSLVMLFLLAFILAARGCAERGQVPLEDLVMSKSALYVGAAVEDLLVDADSPGDRAVKVLARRIDRRLGGGAANMARSHQAVVGRPVRMALLTGPSPHSINPLTEFPQASLICAATSNRIAVAVPRSGGGEPIIYHTRPALDTQAVLAAVRPMLADTTTLAIGPLGHDDFHLLKSLVAEAQRKDVRIYLQLSTAQVEQQEDAVEVLRQLASRDFVQLSLSEATTLTRTLSISESLIALRSSGISANVIITCGPYGAVTQTGNRQPMVTAGFDLGSQTTNVALGDSFGGLMVAGLDIGIAIHELVPLASAQGACQATGQALGDFRKLGKIVATARRRSFRAIDAVPASSLVPSARKYGSGHRKAQGHAPRLVLAGLAASMAWILVILQVSGAIGIT